MTRFLGLILLFASFSASANDCERYLIAPVWRETRATDNPLLDEAAQGVPWRTRQREALTVISESGRVEGELRRQAQKKLPHFSADARTPIKWRGAGAELNLQDALEFVVVSFRNPATDVKILRAAIRELGASPLSNDRTIQVLLPIARGVQLAQPSNARQANEAIMAITSRTGRSLPERNPSSSPTPRSELETLLFEPVTSVAQMGAGLERGVNKKYLITFADGRRAIFKPTTGERFYDAEDRHTDVILFNREVSAYDIAENWLGSAARGLVPETVEVVLTHGGQSYGAGSLQIFKENFIPLSDLQAGYPEYWRAVAALPEWQSLEARIRAIDYLLGNYDRFPNSKHRQGNLDNLMVRFSTDELAVALIDNGVGRKHSPEFGIENSPIRDHIPADFKLAVLKFDVAGFRAAYSDRLPANGVEDFLGRIEALKRRILDGP